MRIKKGEHTIWFVRYHENDLQPDERLEVEAFLILNPDLQSEFDYLFDARLKNHDASHSWTQLRKPEVPAHVHDRNHFLARALESDLSKDEMHSLKISLMADPTLHKDWQLMQACVLKQDNTVLDKTQLYCAAGEDIPAFLLNDIHLDSLVVKADSKIVFEAKALLKQQSPVVAKATPIIKFIRYASAAAAILVFAWILFPESDTSGNGIVVADNAPLIRQGKMRLVESPETNAVFVKQTPPVKGQKQRIIETAEQVAADTDRMSIQKMHLKSPPKFEVEPNYELAYHPSTQVVTSGQQEDNVTLPLASNQGYLSLSDFAKMQLNKTLTGDENPESGLVYATLDQAAKKITEKSGTPVEIKLPVNRKSNKDFNIRIGKFGVSHTTAPTNQP